MVLKILKGLQVRRDTIKNCLVFLIANNTLYVEHKIGNDSLNELPKNDLVLEMLLIHDNVDENNINDTSSCASNQDTEIDEISEESENSCDTEKGNATGSNSLIEKNIQGLQFFIIMTKKRKV